MILFQPKKSILYAGDDNLEFIKIFKYIINWYLFKRFGNEPELSWAKKNSYDLFVDVGANHGLYTVALSKQAKKTLAVEPLIENIRFLRATTFFIKSRVEIFQLAVSDKRGRANLVCYDWDKRSTRAQIVNYEINAINLGQVETITLDELVSEHVGKNSAALFKVDVEGHELSVIKGATQILEAGSTWIVEIVIEQNSSYEQVFEIFEDYNYQCFIVNPVTLETEPFDWQRKPITHINYIFKK